MRVISVGGPGIATMILPSRSTHQPGAVPRGFGIARPDGITQHCFTLRLGHLYAARLEEAAQRRLQFRVDVRLLAHDGRDRLARQVVLRRAEAAGADDEVAALARPPDRLRQPVEVVADDVLVVDVDAERRQPRRDVRRVRIDDLAEQDLGADGEDFSFHCR